MTASALSPTVTGRDALGVLTLSTGAQDWLAEEPALFPH